MNTNSNASGNFPVTASGPCQDGIDLASIEPGNFAFAASPLPVTVAGEGVGIALSFTQSDGEEASQDRFDLIVVDAVGSVLNRFGPFTDEDVVAHWRDFAASSGLPRMILREDGSLAVVSRQIGRLALGGKRQRRRIGLLAGRRPRFLTRRKSSRLPARPQIHRGEKEIIARS